VYVRITFVFRPNRIGQIWDHTSVYRNRLIRMTLRSVISSMEVIRRHFGTTVLSGRFEQLMGSLFPCEKRL